MDKNLKNSKNFHQILLSTTRDNYLDSCYFGSVYLANSDGIYKHIGFDPCEITFMRSLAKPMQASIICDCNIINDFRLEEFEIAIFSGSHSGSTGHIIVLKNLLKKHGLKFDDIDIAPLHSLDLRDKGNKTKLKNNCSAKHVMMLLMCKYLGYDFDNYVSEKHPVQKLIYKKQVELTKYKSKILTKDGCSTPMWGLPYENIIEGYFNLFNNKKYDVLINSIRRNAYVYGGHDRFDTEIMLKSKSKLFAKVGAGGFILIYNFNKREILLLKLAQNNNEARKLITYDILKKLNWLDVEVLDYELNQKKQKVAKYCYEFEI